MQNLKNDTRDKSATVEKQRL